MNPFCPGIDLHLKRTYLVLIDTKREVREKQRGSIGKNP